MCYRLLGLAFSALTTEPVIFIPGIKLRVNQFLFFAGVLFHRWGRDGKNGRYLADGLGAGKVSPDFAR